MTKLEKVNYWLKSAENDWNVAGHLFEKGDYPYALFFGHLTIEKLLKAVFAGKFDEPLPFTHRLTHLVETDKAKAIIDNAWMPELSKAAMLDKYLKNIYCEVIKSEI